MLGFGALKLAVLGGESCNLLLIPTILWDGFPLHPAKMPVACFVPDKGDLIMVPRVETCGNGQLELWVNSWLNHFCFPMVLWKQKPALYKVTLQISGSLLFQSAVFCGPVLCWVHSTWFRGHPESWERSSCRKGFTYLFYLLTLCLPCIVVIYLNVILSFLLFCLSPWGTYCVF